MKKNSNVLTEDLTEERKGLDPTPDSNPDPITKEPGAHPVGVAGGAAGGAAAGGAIGGVIGGPVGAAVGAAVGAIAGGLAGKGAAELVNPTVEDSYWRENFTSRPYYKSGSRFEDYQPAYRYGYESAIRPDYRGKRFEDIEKDLSTGWPTYSRTNTSFNDYRLATRDAFNRVSERTDELGHETAQRTDSVWEQIKGNWKQFKGSVKEKWNDLTDDEIEQMDGRRERIVGKIQEHYGEAKWNEARIESELNDIYKRNR